MSYRYPHADDSDENGFGESLQTPQASAPQFHASEGSEDDVFEDSETHNVETTEDDDDDDDEDDDYEDMDDEEDEYHGLCTAGRLGLNGMR